MIERIRREIEMVQARFGAIEVDPNLASIIVTLWGLPPGWNKAQTRVLILIPPGYPTTPPDNFHTDPDLRLSNGNDPGNATGIISLVGTNWRQFSFHVDGDSWRPHADPMRGDNLLSFCDGIAERFREAT